VNHRDRVADDEFFAPRLESRCDCGRRVFPGLLDVELRHALLVRGLAQRRPLPADHRIRTGDGRKRTIGDPHEYVVSLIRFRLRSLVFLDQYHRRLVRQARPDIGENRFDLNKSRLSCRDFPSPLAALEQRHATLARHPREDPRPTNQLNGGAGHGLDRRVRFACGRYHVDRHIEFPVVVFVLFQWT
jgi:hypothetical protein